MPKNVNYCRTESTDTDISIGATLIRSAQHASKICSTDEHTSASGTWHLNLLSCASLPHGSEGLDVTACTGESEHSITVVQIQDTDAI